MNKHTPEITDAERAELIDAARTLAQEFDALGSAIDADGRFPVEMVDRYKASGLVAAAVPKRYGGKGADILTMGQVQRELAKGDAAIALSFNMHQAMVGIFRGTTALTEGARERVMRTVAEERKLLCGPFSEARAGLAGLADTRAVPDPAGGWRISGKKNWATMIEGADLIALNATITDPDGRIPDDFEQHAQRESMFIVPSDLPGLTIERTWNTLGMRGTGSHTLVLDEVHVDESTFAGNFREGLTGEAEWSAMLFGGVYLGLAERALDESNAALAGKSTGATLNGNDSQARQAASVHYVTGRMRYQLDLATRAFERTGELAIEGAFDGLPVAARKAKFDVAKVATTEAAIGITDQALRLVGGQAFRKGHVVERLFRDARAGVQHSLGTDQLYDFFGRSQFASIP